MSEADARLTFDWRAALFGVVVMALMAAGGWWASRSDRAHGPGPRPSVSTDGPDRAAEPREPSVPSELADAPVEALRTALGATVAFDLSRDGTRVYAFFFEVVPHAYDVDFFRWSVERQRFERFGPMIGPTGFDPPELAGDPPVLRMHERHLGIDFVFSVDGDDIRFEPAPPYALVPAPL